MSYKIVLDSCGELPEKLRNDPHFERVPLSLEVGDYHVMDDDTFDQKRFLKEVAACPTCPKSACPSPEKYMEAYRTEADRVYVITLSSHLSGSYNSAELGRQLYLDTYGHKDIAVIDSESASIGETQIALLAVELEEQGVPFDEIVSRLLEFRTEQKTYFVLDNLETLRKNGRLSTVKAMVASTLSIKPVMSAKSGVIIQKGQTIGIKKAMIKMVDYMLQERGDLSGKRVMISHVNCPERAEYFKEQLLKRTKLKDILILNTAGVSSMYANDGGIIVSV